MSDAQHADLTLSTAPEVDAQHANITVSDDPLGVEQAEFKMSAADGRLRDFEHRTVFASAITAPTATNATAASSTTTAAITPADTLTLEWDEYVELGESPYQPQPGNSIELSLRPFTPRDGSDLTLHVDDHGPGVIKGRVANGDGEIEGATIEAVNQDTLEARQTQTDEYGEYRIEQLDGGSYHVTVRAEIDNEMQSDVSHADVPVSAYSER